MLKKLSDFFLRTAVPSAGCLIIFLVGRSIRVKRVNFELFLDLKKRKENVIYAFWHNRLALMPYFYRYFFCKKAITVLISRSRDGQIISDIVERFGFKVVRGSSSRGGKTAFREMIKLLNKGYDGGFTPDGPRGPRYSVSEGVITLAQLTGCTIVPASWEVDRKKIINSWDRMMIPMPFSRGVFLLGNPITVSKDANENQKAEKMLELKKELFRLIELGAKQLEIECEPLPNL